MFAGGRANLGVLDRCVSHSVLKGGGQKNVFFRENQRFVLVNWVKLLNVQPWGPCWSHGEKIIAKNGHFRQYLAISTLKNYDEVHYNLKQLVFGEK